MSKEEFAIVAEKYMDTIYRVAYSWLKNQDDANDVTQDVLIKLYKSTKEFESDSHMKNWLIKVTVNECKMLFRSPWRKTDDIIYLYLPLRCKKSQPQGIGHYRHRRKAHRCRSDHGIKQNPECRVQHTCSHGNADRIVEKRPEQVLPDITHDSPA